MVARFIVMGQPGKDRGQYRNQVQMEYQAQTGAADFYDLPLSVDITVVYAMDRGWSEERKRDMQDAPCIRQPSSHNVAHSVIGSLDKIAYADSGQIVSLHVRKQWGQRDCAYITIQDWYPDESCEGYGGRLAERDLIRSYLGD